MTAPFATTLDMIERRAAGQTWTEIGAAHGMTGQGAEQRVRRFRDRADDELTAWCRAFASRAPRSWGDDVGCTPPPFSFSLPDRPGNRDL